MKTKFKSVAFLLFLALSHSCSSPLDEACIGCQDDTIGVSKNLVQFSAESNSTTITTKGNSWWFTDIELNGNRIDLNQVNKFSHQFKIEEPEFIIERKSANELFIQMNKNNLKLEQKLSIDLMHLNFGTRINIIQSNE